MPRYLTEPRNQPQNNDPDKPIKPPGWFFRTLLEKTFGIVPENGSGELRLPPGLTQTASQIIHYELSPPVTIEWCGRWPEKREKASGLSRQEFCQQRSMPLTTFDYWRREHAGY